MNQKSKRAAWGIPLGIALAIVLAIGLVDMALYDGSEATGSRTPIDLASLGPQVGERVPGFSLPDQNGQIRTLESILGPNGAMLLFHRSADWLPYCKTQLVELQDRVEELSDQGIGVAAISYDSEEILADFSQRRGITFPLLSDDDSKVITEFGILNTVAAEAQGPNADDPDVVADVARYISLFGAALVTVGTPFPGTFMLDRNGRVTSRFFEEFYRERNTTANVMLKLGIGLSPIAAIEGSTAHLKLTAYPSNTSVTVGTRFSIAVEIEPNPGIHVYAPGAEEMGYRVVSLNMRPVPHVRFEPVEFPASEIYYFEPLDERVPVYQKPFMLLQEVVVSGAPDAEEALAQLDALTLSGTFDYQACDDELCFEPVSVPLSFTLDLDLLDRQRANR